MKKLLYRDLRLVFCVRNVVFYILLLICLMMRLWGKGETLFAMVLILAGITVSGVIWYDQSRGGVPDMPDPGTDRIVYVKEKYLLLLIMEAADVLAGAALWKFCDMRRITPPTVTDAALAAASCVPFVICAVSLVIPFDLKFGSARTVPLKLIVFSLLAAFFAGAFMNLWYRIDPYLGSRIRYYWMQIPETVILLIFSAGAAAAVYISYRISKRIVTEKGYRLEEVMRSGSVSRNIKFYRLADGMTQDQLAEKMYVTRQTVSNWENGKAQPDLDTLMKLSEVFDTEVSNLLSSGKKKEQGTGRGVYVLVCMALFILIHAALRLRDICSARQWLFAGGALIYYRKAVDLLTPLLLNPPIFILGGALLMSFLSIWVEIKAGKRRGLAGIAGAALLVPTLAMAARVLILYANEPLADEYIKLSVRLPITVILPFISGALLFLLFTGKREKDV